MKIYNIRVFTFFLAFFSIISSSRCVLAHDEDEIYYVEELAKYHIEDYRQIHLYEDNSGKSGYEIYKPVSGMKLIIKNNSYYETTKEGIAVTVPIGTPIYIDFNDSTPKGEIEEIGLQITNGTGREMDWHELPNGSYNDTAYASQYPFSWGNAMFTPQEKGTYSFYGEVRLNVDESQIYEHWDAWSDNGLNGQLDYIKAHSEAPAGPYEMYPMSWYFQRINITVVDPDIPDKGSIKVVYKNKTTAEELPGSPIQHTNISIGSSEPITAPNIIGYKSTGITYRQWYGTEDLADSISENPFPGSTSITISADKLNWFVYLFYDPVPPENGRVTILQMNAETNTPISGGSKVINNLDLGKDYTYYNTEITAPTGASYEGTNKSYTSTYPALSDKFTTGTGQTVSLTTDNKEAWIYFYYKIDTVIVTPPPTAAKPMPGITADKLTIMLGEAFTVIDKCTPGVGATKITKWHVNSDWWDLKEHDYEDIVIGIDITSPSSFFKTYTPKKSGIYHFVVSEIEDDKGGTNSEAKGVTVTVNEPDPRPPVAVILNQPTIMLGEDTSILSGSYDPDNDIKYYYWTLANASPAISGEGGTTAFSIVGTYTITLKVLDSKGLSNTATSTIEVIPPYPTAVISFTGRLKENYKVISDSKNSYSLVRYPIDGSKTVWTFQAVSGCSTNDIKYLGVLNGLDKKPFLVKKKGNVRVGLTVTNTAGYSNTTYADIDIAENLPPIADLVVPKSTLREYRDTNGNIYGKVLVTDTSYSPDGDRIIRRTYFRTYDANNDKQFTEPRVQLYDGLNISYIDIYYNDEGVGLCLYDVYVVEDLLERDAEGNYINTIIEFIDPVTDVKTGSTF